MKKKDRQMHMQERKCIYMLLMLFLCISIISGSGGVDPATNPADPATTTTDPTDPATSTTNPATSTTNPTSTTSPATTSSEFEESKSNQSNILKSSFLLLLPFIINPLYYMQYKVLTIVVSFLYLLVLLIYMYIGIKQNQRPRGILIRGFLWAVSILIIIGLIISLVVLFLFIKEKGFNMLQLLEILPLFYGLIVLLFIILLPFGIYKSDILKNRDLDSIFFYILSFVIILLSIFGICSRLFMTDPIYFEIVHNLVYFLYLPVCVITFLYEQKVSTILKISAEKLFFTAILSFLSMIVFSSIVVLFLYEKEPLFPGIASYFDSIISYLRSIVLIKPAVPVANAGTVV